MIENVLTKFSNSEDLYAMMDGKIIARKSLYEASVYDSDYKNLITYKSRIQHCGSCLSEAEEGYSSMDECCCIHSTFHSKKEENDYVKSIGFWGLKLS